MQPVNQELIMKQIVVISGKGGTGKTSITASLAKLSDKNTVIADCDVEAANLHVLLNPDFNESEDFYSGHTAFIDKNKCSECGKCKEVCKFKAIENYTIKKIHCEGCGYCVVTCAENAVSLQSTYRGKVYISNTRLNKWLVHTVMEIGSQNSGKLVAYVKETAKKIALKNKSEYVLIDGSPGIGCPVIASLSGADLALIVTEPSISGKSDMVRIHLLIKKMNVRTAIIVNKSDVNKKISAEILNYARENNITVIENIPYNNVFNEAQVKRRSVTEFANNEICTKIKNSWTKIINLVNN
jgi:MinD superfamily P-loop ATPase